MTIFIWHLILVLLRYFFCFKGNVPGLETNVNMKDLTNSGFRLVYNYTYNHITTRAEILSIRSQCTSSTTICVGGNRYNEIFLRLVACANCLSVTTETTLNSPQFYGRAYWYFTNGLSFGFAPTNVIYQGSADTTDQSSNLRLSWHLDGVSGGWRLGNAINLSGDTTYLKKIYLN
jgi:hypothetical protein